MKIADFGLAKSASFLNRKNSSTIVSLWYRAPEIILKHQEYLSGVDIWSVGCILAEFFSDEPIFKSDSDKICLDKIFSLLGSPVIERDSFYVQFKNDLAVYNL